MVRQIDKHHLGPERRGRLQRYILGRIRGERIPDGEPRRDVRRRAVDAVEAEHVVVVAVRGVDRHRRLGLRIDDERDEVVRLVRSFDEDDLRLAAFQRHDVRSHWPRFGEPEGHERVAQDPRWRVRRCTTPELVTHD